MRARQANHDREESNMTEARVSEFAFTKLVVKDLQAMAAFYRTVCGYGEGQFVEAAIGARPVEEIIFSKPQGRAELVLLKYLEGPQSSPSGVITAFNTPDLDAFQMRVLAAGGAVIDPIKPLEFGTSRMRIAFFADIEGFLLEVLER